MVGLSQAVCLTYHVEHTWEPTLQMKLELKMLGSLWSNQIYSINGEMRQGG
jgi:hypothetical protein